MFTINVRDDPQEPMDKHHTHLCLRWKSCGVCNLQTDLWSFKEGTIHWAPFPFPQGLIKDTLGPSQPRLPSYRAPPIILHVPRTAGSLLPSKRQVRKSKQKVLKTGFRCQWLSPSGQLLGTPGRPTTVRRTPWQTVPRPWAHILTLPSVPAAPEGVRRRGRNKEVGEEETSRVKMTAERAGRGERPGRMLGVEP